jgi:rRNA pseudouridine-1189 N-methylase Emg1 (Nep1/Mra1 family)
MKNKFNKSKKIILEFSQDNNFDRVEEEYGKTDAGVIKIVRWVIGCAHQAIIDSYTEGSPRRIEMDRIYQDLRKQLESQLTKEQIENILNT